MEFSWSSHEVPDRPGQKIACDLFTVVGNDYLLTLSFLRDSAVGSKIITIHGIPDEVTWNNGPQFSSRKFKQLAE